MKFYFRSVTTAVLVLSCALALNGQNYFQMGQDIDGEAANDRAGTSVSVSDDGFTVAIGAPANTSSVGAAGQVRVYHWNGSSWYQMGADIDGYVTGDNFGYAVALSDSGTSLVVGAIGAAVNGTFAGQTRVYDWDSTNWVQRGNPINGLDTLEWSGCSVSISNDAKIVAVGALGNDDSAINAGQVRIYYWNDTNWVQRGNAISGDLYYDMLGASVSLSSDGNTVAAGGDLSDANGPDSGVTKIFEWNGNAWVQKGIDIPGETNNDHSGHSVDISSDGNVVVIGAPESSIPGHSGAGQMRVFVWSGIAWVQQGATVSGFNSNEKMGTSVSISEGGDTVAMGGIYGGAQIDAGIVRVYAWSGAAWVICGQAINGEAAFDHSGCSVSINSDGTVLAIGASDNAGNGFQSGHTRVYSNNTSVGLIPNDNSNVVMTVFPNPADGDIVIFSTENILTATVMDSEGRVVVEREGDDQSLELNLSEFGNGVYFVRVLTATGMKIQKVVVNK